MTHEKFNKLSLDEKFSFIKESLNGQPCGFMNETIFRDKTISFFFGENGVPISATAYPLEGQAEKSASKILERLKIECMNFPQDNERPSFLQKAIDKSLDTLKN